MSWMKIPERGIFWILKVYRSREKRERPRPRAIKRITPGLSDSPIRRRRTLRSVYFWSTAVRAATPSNWRVNFWCRCSSRKFYKHATATRKNNLVFYHCDHEHGLDLSL